MPYVFLIIGVIVLAYVGISSFKKSTKDQKIKTIRFLWLATGFLAFIFLLKTNFLIGGILTAASLGFWSLLPLVNKDSSDQEQVKDEPASNANYKKSPMSIDEALDVLGLKAGASTDDIKEAYHNLMKKNHPDQGGSKYIAVRINDAKEVLLRENKK